MSRAEPSIVYFDGVCGLCNGFVDFLVRRDGKKRLRFAPLQGSTAQTRLPAALRETPLESVVLQSSEKIHRRSDAALRALADLGGGWTMLGLLLWIPLPLRDGIYGWIAAHRYRWFGQRKTCRIPSAEEADRFLD